MTCIIRRDMMKQSPLDLFMGMEKRGCTGVRTVPRSGWRAVTTDLWNMGEQPKEVM